MTSTGLSPRPRQLILAAGVVIVGAAVLLLAAFDSLASLRSIDVRDQMSQLVSSPSGRSLGLGVDQLISAFRVVLGLTAVCAAVALVLGIFVLQRHRGARLGLSVVAVPLLITSPFVGGFLGAMVAAATVTLWSGPCRDWYDGRPIREPAPGTRHEPDRPPMAPPPPPGAPRGAPPVLEPPSTASPSAAPGATQGFGTPQRAPVAPPVPGWPPAYPTSAQGPEQGTEQGQAPPPQGEPWAWPAPAPRLGRGGVPGPVKAACVLTWVFSGVVALLYLAALVTMMTDRSAIVDRVVRSPEWQRAGIGAGAVEPMLWAGILFFIAWSVGAMVLAWFTWRRHNWARWLLGTSALVTLLAATLVFPAGAAHQIACAVTLGLLLGPRARSWFAGDTPRRLPPRPPGPGPW